VLSSDDAPNQSLIPLNWTNVLELLNSYSHLDPSTSSSTSEVLGVRITDIVNSNVSVSALGPTPTLEHPSNAETPAPTSVRCRYLNR